MYPPGLKLLMAIGVSLVIAADAQAQPLVAQVESIECTVANADLVFVATLIKFGGEQQSEPGKFHEGSIDIEETLKDDLLQEERYQKLSVRLPYPEAVLANWKERAVRLLVTVNSGAPDATRALALAPETLEVLTADFQLLRDPEDVIRISKESVNRFPAFVRRVHTFRLWVPREMIVGTRWESAYGLVLEVPVDEQLEKRAQDGIRSPSYITREEGARALRYFKSDDNIARVKTLLNDPGWSIWRDASQNDGIEVRFYGVRKAAFQTLKSWGVKTEQPETLEEVRK